MKLTNKIVLLLIALFSLSVHSQSKLKSKKQIEKELADAGYAFIELNVDQSLKLSKQALNDALLLKDDVLVAKAYNLIALNFEEFYDVKKSLNLYNKALNYANKTDNDSIKCWINNNIGNVYSYRENNFEKSLPYYINGLKFSERMKDSIEIMYSNLNITGAYFSANKFNEGLKYLENIKSFVEKSKMVEANITTNNLYGLYYSNKKMNKEAEESFFKAIKYGTINKDNLYESYLSDVYKNLSDFYSENKEFEKALKYFKLHDEIIERIYNEDRKKNAKIAGSAIEIDEYERKINVIEEEKEIQFNNLKKSKSIIALFLFLIAVLSYLTYNYYKNFKLRDKLNKQLSDKNEELKIAKEKAELASQLKTQFVSTISHELRTPLYGVVGITNIILDEHKELEKSPHLNSLKFSARYLLSLVNDLLQINKIEENRVVLEKMIFNINDEVNTIANSLEFIAIKNNNKIITEFDTEIQEFLIGDKLRLSQIILNLVSNALKFTKNGEVKVIVTAEKIENNKQYLKFEIQDNGVGIAKEDQEKIFEKFVQIERKEGDYQGTGLGLSIVKKLLEVFGSEIKLKSELGVGTTFTFTIPFDIDEQLRNEIINNIEVDLSTSQIYNVLVVEDNKINQVVTKKFLENNNFKCTIVDDGYAAIDLLETNHFDFILMDINMPIINGFETTKLIRKKGYKIPIVALTAFDKQEVSEEAISSGMNDVIIKPFEAKKLVSIINNLVSNH